MYLSMFLHADSIDQTQPYEVLFITLDALLSELKIPHDSSLESMIHASQVWRRKSGQERWELPALAISQRSEHKTFELLELLGLTAPVVPSEKQYDFALLLGATAPGMKQRLNYLADCWSQGVRFKRLIYLVGQRPLNPGIDNLELLIKKAGNPANKKLDSFPVTETDAAILVHRQTPMPSAMKRLPVEFIDTPGNWSNGSWHRPNTRDTLKHWAKTKPLPGTALVISDQPHGIYQKEVVKQELSGFSIDLAAGPADPATTLPVYLDALALWLHNLQPFGVWNRQHQQRH